MWHPEQNRDGEPLDYEDKWGKANAPNFAFYVPSQGLSIDKKSQNGALSAKSGNVTLDFWLKEHDMNEMLVLCLLQDAENLAIYLMRE